MCAGAGRRALSGWSGWGAQVLAYAGPEYEVFAYFDALAELDAAAAICQRLCAWVKAQQADLFVPL